MVCVSKTIFHSFWAKSLHKGGVFKRSGTGLAEIGGGYLVWLWLREGKGAVFRGGFNKCDPSSALPKLLPVPGQKIFQPPFVVCYCFRPGMKQFLPFRS
ncbi:YnfA family protein [Desulfofundulus luciae]|uniref:hypothetical protein n=1 Tax=Desulfofundulus luciae TaxID=74702 RepID=UPI003898D80D